MNERRIAAIYILLFGSMLYAGPGRADSWQQAITSRVSTEFDTNPSMSPTYTRGIWRALFEPSYTLTGRDGVSETRAGLALQIARSSNKALSPNRDSPTAFWDWSRQSEVGQLGISSRYAEIATRDGGGIDATGHVPAGSTRASRNLSGTWSKEVSELSTLTADASYEGVTYKGGTFVDYSTEAGGIKFSHALNEHVTPYCRIAANRYVPANGTQSTNRVDANLGLEWKVENLEWNVQAGKSRAEGGNSDTEGMVSIQFTGQRSQLGVNASRSVAPSGQDGFVKTDQIRGGWSYALSEYTNTGIDLDRRRNHSFAANSTSSGATSGIWIDNNLTASWKMRTYYQHRIYQGSGIASAFSNMLGLSFVYDNPNF